jgi:hypothetical protein
MLGPYKIVSHQGNEKYIIADERSGEQHSEAVPGNELKRL